MNKVIKLLDYANNHKDIDVDLDDVSRIEIRVVTGDELLLVTHKDGTIRWHDSSSCRRTDYFDYSYVVFDKESGINILEKDWFNKRHDSYSVINNYPETKEYVLDYDLEDGTDAYINYNVIEMLTSNSVG